MAKWREAERQRDQALFQAQRADAQTDFQRLMMSEIKPIDDVRSTAEYRRRVCANLLARFWQDVGGGQFEGRV